MKVNTWITGYVFRGNYKTDRSDGFIIGWDNDFGYMVSRRGKLIPVTKQSKPGLLEVDNGVKLIYPDGVVRFISNSWYVDIDTDNL